MSIVIRYLVHEIFGCVKMVASHRSVVTLWLYPRYVTALAVLRVTSVILVILFILIYSGVSLYTHINDLIVRNTA